MEYGSIERDFHVEASPEVVFEVLSSPAHIKEWWGCETGIEAATGSTSELVWDDGMAAPITVIQADPPRLFSFRWAGTASADGPAPAEGNSLLVTFVLTPSATGTSVRLTETGFREIGWEIAVLEETYRDHEVGWTLHLGHLSEYLTRLVSAP
jgi:uncharacterized protein YndB with AHSA1/START domain